MRRAVLIAALLLQACAVADAQAATSCRSVRLPVSLAAGTPADGYVAGELCRPPGARTLQVLLSGATYGRAYWDPPVRSAAASYVRMMRASGSATLNLDRIGIGHSSHPPAETVTVPAGAYVTHQVVQAARAGAFGARFERVVAVGHSLGSAIALVEAATYQDVDGLIVSGLLAHAPPVGAPALVAALQPAQLEPRFGDRPPGYLTTRAGTRGEVLYAPGGAHPDVIALDERTKETVTTGELATLGEASQPWVDAAIRVPVLSVVGEFDNVFCPSSCAAPASPAFAEARHYPGAPSFETFVLAGSGHVVNLHRQAPRWFAAARRWLERLEAQRPGGRPR